MASESDNLFALLAANGNIVEDEKFSFRRLEMFMENLAEIVGAYDRHVFLYYKSPKAWPSKVEGSKSNPLLKLLFFALSLSRSSLLCSALSVVPICYQEHRSATKNTDLLPKHQEHRSATKIPDG
nr:hypothetical protein CFP56_79747 [Quercus suber]